MTTGDFYIFATIIALVSIIVGFITLNYKLNSKLENDERIIKRLDLLIKNLNHDKENRDAGEI